MYHHFLKKGIEPWRIDNLSNVMRYFYAASMELEIKDVQKEHCPFVRRG